MAGRGTYSVDTIHWRADYMAKKGREKEIKGEKEKEMKKVKNRKH